MTILASCGHVLTDADGEDGMGHMVFYKSVNCDAIDGFKPCYAYACYCTKCRDDLKNSDEWLEDGEAADRWLDSPEAKNFGKSDI